jgi:hypothetical protein
MFLSSLLVLLEKEAKEMKKCVRKIEIPVGKV